MFKKQRQEDYEFKIFEFYGIETVYMMLQVFTRV